MIVLRMFTFLLSLSAVKEALLGSFPSLLQLGTLQRVLIQSIYDQAAMKTVTDTHGQAAMNKEVDFIMLLLHIQNILHRIGLVSLFCIHTHLFVGEIVNITTKINFMFHMSAGGDMLNHDHKISINLSRCEFIFLHSPFFAMQSCPVCLWNQKDLALGCGHQVI